MIFYRLAHNGEINGEINSLSDGLRTVYLLVKNNPGAKIKKIAALLLLGDEKGRKGVDYLEVWK